MRSSAANRLAAEKSPYLQQHAANPVDWYPWGDAAFAAARASNKPIFLSIGYSTCHWCHVMAHESFEDPEIAALMNRHYINIKVDREERPDVDAIYMTAVQALTGSGGWPMSVWLTPDLKPFFGGTYFPPEDRWGRPGFPSVLQQLADIYANDKDRVAGAAEQVSSLLIGAAAGGAAEGATLPRAADAMSAAFRSLEAAFDPANGGFSPAPKFPMPVYLEFLLDHHARAKDPQALSMALFSFRKMAEGGLYDHLGGGFARYSTDERWLVPHFEKMLYDNAQLMRAGAGLWSATRDPFIREIVLGTADYLMRDLRHASGGFFSAEDADSEGREGAFYLWTMADLKRVLGDDAERAAVRFGVTVQGNFEDPHTREPGQNVLSLAAPMPAGSEPEFAEMRDKLFAERSRRARPHRDEKILTEWNGLAISALARSAFALNDDRLLRAADEAADFLQKELYDARERRLFRRWRDGDRAIDGQLADHAMFVEGLLDLFEATGNPRRLELALELQRRQDELFLDQGVGGYFTNRPAPDLLVRMKEDGDNVIPSGNATAVRNALRLAALTGDETFRANAEMTLRFFASSLSSRPYSFAKLTAALPWIEGAFREIVVAGDPASPAYPAMVDEVRRSAPRDAVVVLAADGAAKSSLAKILPAIGAMNPPPGGAAGFVCRRFACQAPSTVPAAFRSALSA